MAIARFIAKKIRLKAGAGFGLNGLSLTCGINRFMPIYRLILALSVLILTSLSTNARPLRGDWESSGDLPYVYTPKYPFAYDCQIEISDGRLYNIEGEERYVYAVARVRLDEKRSSVSVKDMEFTAVVRDGQTGDRELKSDVPYAISEARLALGFSQGSRPQGDTVNLWAYVGLELSGYRFGDDGRGHFKRGDKVLRAKTSVSAAAVNGDGHLSRQLYVECDKIR